MMVQACDRVAPTPWKVREKPPPLTASRGPQPPPRFFARPYHKGLCDPVQTWYLGPDGWHDQARRRHAGRNIPAPNCVGLGHATRP